MEVDHVPYIFGSFSRRRHSQEVNKNNRRSFDQTPNEININTIPPKKDTFERTRSLSKPFLDFFNPPKRDENKETIIEEEFGRRKSAIRLALDDTSPIFGQTPNFPKSIRKDTNSLRTRGSFRTTFEENVQFFPSIKKTEEIKTDDGDDFTCFWCKKTYAEPRVLSCLHSFCTKCLFEIENDEYNNVFDVPNDLKNGSICSELIRESNNERKNSINPRKKRITCPKCEKVSLLFGEGIHGLPHNYIIQHKLVLASLNQENTKLLCDVCAEENVATHRCTECLINLCPSCIENHVRQVSTSHHEILGLKDKAISKITRQIMCHIHYEQELSIYCSTCNQVTCKECMRTIHLHHVGENPTKMVYAKNVGLKDALERTKSYTNRAETLSEKLKNNQKSWVTQCATVEEEIEKFIEEYKKNIDDHKVALLQQVTLVRDEQIKILSNHQRNLENRIHEAKTTIKFADDILKEGTEIEILTFVDTILKKLQNLSCNEDDLLAPKISENVQFLENEIKENPDGKFPLIGVISTQKVSIENCTIKKEGTGLDNLRVHRKVEIILETKDSSDNPLSHGGLKIGAELWYRDAGMSCRSLSVNVYDKRDGTYLITFVPDTPGKLSLGVTVKGQHIQDSPFPITVRNIRQHKGVYHCCSFCSGGKGGACGCGGRMPGQRGCGHGHEGHPGRRHWSCCGHVLENSECRRQSIYQFTL